MCTLLIESSLRQLFTGNLDLFGGCGIKDIDPLSAGLLCPLLDLLCLLPFLFKKQPTLLPILAVSGLFMAPRIRPSALTPADVHVCHQAVNILLKVIRIIFIPHSTILFRGLFDNKPLVFLDPQLACLFLHTASFTWVVPAEIASKVSPIAAPAARPAPDLPEGV